MKHRYIFISLFIVILVLTGCSNKINTVEDNSNKGYCDDCNVILIIIDTLRADHLGVYGYHRNTTPNIDKLASESVVFSNALSQSSWTKPSTASILTGLYPKNHGANTREDVLEEERLILSEILLEKEYSTSAFISNLNVVEEFGFNQGYTNFKEWGTDSNKKRPFAYSDEMNKEIFKFLEGKSNLERKNNFLYIHYMDPHWPYIPKETHFSKNNTQEFSLKYSSEGTFYSLTEEEKIITIKDMIDAYDDEIKWVDKQLGNLLSYLKDIKLYENSIIIITSDHGEEFMEHGGIHHGQSLYNEQLRVPLIIKIPKQKNALISDQVSLIDIFPSILNLLNISVNFAVDGKNFFSEDKMFNKGNTKFSYAELELDRIHSKSVQTEKEKFIGYERHHIPKNDIKLFKNNAVLETNSKEFSINIQSFKKNKVIKSTVFNNKGIINSFSFQITPNKKIILLPSILTRNYFSLPYKIKFETEEPCEETTKFSKNKRLRCLSFAIHTKNDNNNDYKSNHRNENNIYFYEITSSKEEYYNLNNDKNEQFNLNSKKSLESKNLKEVLKSYILDNDYDEDNINKQSKNKIKPETLEKLKALGYIN